MKPKKDKIQGVIFDIDGVIVDTRKSYLESICITTELYLSQILGFRSKGGKLLTLKDVETFKMLGGFNNDWDCTEGLLLYFLSLVPARANRQDISIKYLRSKKNISGLLKSKTRTFLNSKKNKALLSYQDIVYLFQEIYLGGTLFKKCYKESPLYWKKAGLYLKEKALTPKKLLVELKKKGLKLGVATGRTRFEAEMVLKQFKIDKCFDSVFTADEIEKEEKKQRRLKKKEVSLSKPHPYLLEVNAKKLKLQHFAYVGDLPDDILTAKRASRDGLNIKAIGTLAGVTEKQRMQRQMKQAGAYSVVKSANELIRCLRKLS
jgi:HAD superfamily phosphatase